MTLSPFVSACIEKYANRIRIETDMQLNEPKNQTYKCAIRFVNLSIYQSADGKCAARPKENHVAEGIYRFGSIARKVNIPSPI